MSSPSPAAPTARELWQAMRSMSVRAMSDDEKVAYLEHWLIAAERRGAAEMRRTSAALAETYATGAAQAIAKQIRAQALPGEEG